MFTLEQFCNACAIISCAIGLYDLMVWLYVKLPEKIIDKWKKKYERSQYGQFGRISIPLIRRIQPQLIANDIVNVQPLLGPTGLMYYLRYRYSQNQGTVNEGPITPNTPGAVAAVLRRKYKKEKVDWAKEGF